LSMACLPFISPTPGLNQFSFFFLWGNLVDWAAAALGPVKLKTFE